MDLSAIYITVSPAFSTECSTQMPIYFCLINESILQGDNDLATNILKPIEWIFEQIFPSKMKVKIKSMDVMNISKVG